MVLPGTKKMENETQILFLTLDKSPLNKQNVIVILEGARGYSDHFFFSLPNFFPIFPSS